MNASPHFIIANQKDQNMEIKPKYIVAYPQTQKLRWTQNRFMSTSKELIVANPLAKK